MRILLLVDKAIPNTGPHRNVCVSIQALAQRSDISLTVLCGPQELDPITLQKISIIQRFYPHKLTRFFQNAIEVRKAIHTCDVIYVPTGLKSFLFAWLFKGSRPLVAGPNVTGIPYLMDMYNPSPLMTMKMADAWIEMSKVRIHQCVTAGTPEEYIHLVPHAVDSNLFSPRLRNRSVWKKFGIAENAKIILFTGRIDSVLKGIPELIQAFQIIKKEIPDAVLVLAGRVQRDIEEFKNVKDVHFVGPLMGEDFVRVIASADLFMAASRYESFWFCPLEAMSCGLPVVVSSVGAVPEMILGNGVQGIRVDITTPESQYLPGAVEKLANAALEILQDPERRQKMGLAAREFVLKEFSVEKLGERLAAVFRGVVKRPLQ